MVFLSVGDSAWAKSLQIRPGNVHGALCVQPCQYVSLNIVCSLQQNLGSDFRRYCGFWFSLWNRELLLFRFTSIKADSSRSDKHLAHQGFKLPRSAIGMIQLVWQFSRVLLSSLWIAPFSLFLRILRAYAVASVQGSFACLYQYVMPWPCLVFIRWIRSLIKYGVRMLTIVFPFLRCFQPISRLVIRFHIGDLHLHLYDRFLVTRSPHSLSPKGSLFDMRW